MQVDSEASHVLRQLRALIQRQWVQLPAREWASGDDRWAELVFCVLDGVIDDPAVSRSLVSQLRELNLLDLDSLSRSDSEDDRRTVLRYIFRQAGVREDAEANAVSALTSLAEVVVKRLGGSIQTYLRHKGEEMRSELVAAIQGKEIASDRLSTAVTLWLQNSLGLPLSTNHAGVRAFCERHEITVEELEQEADSLGVDPAVLDDLIRLDELQPTPR